MTKLFSSVNYIIILFSILIFSACTRDQNLGGIAVPTKVTISLDKNSVVANGIDEIAVTVKDQKGDDITASSVVYVDGTPISGSKVFFNNSQLGTHKVFANKFGVISDTLTITATQPPAAKYTAKVLAEHFTGAWCGWCPRVDYKINSFTTANNKLIRVSIHNGDALTNRTVDSTLRANFAISAVPNIMVDRSRVFQENGDINNLNDSTFLRTFYQKYAVAGLAINSSISGNNLNVTARVGFDANIKDSLRLIVIVTENNIVLPQNNYYNANVNYPANPFFTAGDTINNYVHQAVYRRSPTTVNGITIPADKQVINGEFSANYTIDIAGLNAANLRVVAFVQFAPGQARRGVINAQTVAAGQNINYD